MYFVSKGSAQVPYMPLNLYNTQATNTGKNLKSWMSWMDTFSRYLYVLLYILKCAMVPSTVVPCCLPRSGSHGIYHGFYFFCINLGVLLPWNLYMTERTVYKEKKHISTALTDSVYSFPTDPLQSLQIPVAWNKCPNQVRWIRIL